MILSVNVDMDDLAQAVCAKDRSIIIEFIARIDEIMADSAFTRELRDHFQLVVEQDEKDAALDAGLANDAKQRLADAAARLRDTTPRF